MATTEIKSKVELDLKIQLNLSLGEARALTEIIAYGVEPFLKVYYEHLGQSTLKREEAGVKSLFKTLETLRSRIHESEEIIKAVEGLKR